MYFSDINPYVRYARMLELTPQSHFATVVAVDSRLLYNVSGSGSVIVKGHRYMMSENSLIIIGAGIEYKIEAPTTSVVYCAFNFDYTRRSAHLSLPIRPCALGEFDRSMLTDPSYIEDYPIFCDVMYLEKITTVAKKLSSAVAEYSKRLLYGDMKTGHILAQCLAECASCNSSSCSEYENEITDKLVAYIHDNIGSELSNKIVGEHFDYHPNYISFLIKKATGMPLHRYLIHIRLARAASLLENSFLSIGDIALACGFCDTAHFSSCFKQRFGVSPSSYRNI